MVTRFPQSMWSKKEQGGSHNVFYDLASNITLHCLYNILLVTQVSPIQDRGDLCGAWIWEDKSHQGPLWKLLAHTNILDGDETLI